MKFSLEIEQRDEVLCGLMLYVIQDSTKHVLVGNDNPNRKAALKS